MMWIPIIQWVSHLSDGLLRGTLLSVSAIGLFATAITLGYKWFSWEKRLASSGVVADPIAKPWDKFFSETGSKKQLGIVLTLPDGRKIGGRFSGGFASSYPADEQLHIGQTWTLDQTSGAFQQQVKGTLGFIINMKDVLTTEFFEWENIESNLRRPQDA